MVSTSSLIRNFSWTFLGNAVYAACQWGMVAVLAKVGTPEMVGQFALAFAVTAPIMLFANMKLRAVQATDVQNEYAFGSYIALRLITIPIALFIILAIVLLRYDSAAGGVIAFVGIAKAIESVSDILFGLLQRQELMNRIAWSQMAKGGLALSAFAFILSTTGSLTAGTAAIAAAWLTILTVYDAPTAAATFRARDDSLHIGVWRALLPLRPDWSLASLLSLAWRTLPLGFTVMLGSLTTNTPQYFIEHFRGAHELGLYAAMSYPMVAGALVINALGQSATPRLALYYASGAIPAFRKLVVKLVGLGLLLGLAGIAAVLSFGSQILTSLYSPEYAERQEVFVWIMIAVAIGFGYVFLGTAVTSMRLFAVQMPIHIGSVMVLVSMCALLIPSHGSKGAAWALIGSGLVQASAYALLVIKHR